MYRGLTVGVVVPAYNEEGYVGNVIDDLPPIIDRAYVIDDGSTDGTWEEICQHAEQRNRGYEGEFDNLVEPIAHENNRGVGGAIKTGYLRAREEEIDATVVLGGDDQMDPDELTRYLDPIVEGVADYAKGNRFSDPGHWTEMPRFRFVGNVILSYLTKIASGYWETMDSQNGYTAISLEALERTDIEGMYEYYGYCNDLLIRLNAADVRVADVPRSSEYAYSDGWKSHIDYKEYIPRVSKMLLEGFFWRLRRKYLLTGYSPVAPLYLLGIGTLAGSGVGLLRSLVSRESETGPWVVSTVVGALVFLYASMRDHVENTSLQQQVDPGALAPDGDDDTGSAGAREGDELQAESGRGEELNGSGGASEREGDRVARTDGSLEERSHE